MRVGATQFLLFLVAAAVLVGPARRALASDELPQADAVARIMTAWSAEATAAPEDAVKRLRALGAPAFPALLAAAQDAKPGSPAAAVLDAAVRAHRFETLRDHLRARVRAHAGTHVRVAALHTVARYGGADGLSLAVELVSGFEPVMLTSRATIGAWEAALTAALESDVQRHALSRALTKIPARLQAGTARALASTGTPEALWAIAQMLDAAPEHAAPLLRALGRATPLSLARLDTPAITRRWLRATSPDARAAAIALTARARNASAMPMLIDLLNDDDARVRVAARRALQTQAGTTVGTRSEAWRTWLDAEEAWLSRSAIAERLTSDDVAEVSRALGEIRRHSFISGRLVADLAALTGRDQVGIRRLAAAALGQLGRLEASSSLAALLDDEDEGVRTAAHQALVRLTGERLPAERRAWDAALRRT